MNSLATVSGDQESDFENITALVSERAEIGAGFRAGRNQGIPGPSEGGAMNAACVPEVYLNLSKETQSMENLAP